ncbi:DNA-binding protein [Paenibacillus ihuae]|uniref:DNA-binding protein n=1 Tax=Paenibacillus ihuae TaxID=1232431 RepID=UPI001FD79CA4|nr:DNA-binding protein [Paenibacillus ihuae]
MKLTTLRSEIENNLFRSGYNLASFAKVSGLNRGSLSAILHGNPPKPVSLGQLDALTKAFGFPEGWFYTLYVDECFSEDKVSRRRVEPFLIRCVETGKQQCVDEIINRIMEYPKPLDVVYSVAEKLFAGGKIQEAKAFYKIIVEHEQDSSSERLAISQYRIFKSLESVMDMEEMLRAVITFEPFRGRIPDHLQLDGLLKLANVCFTLHRWSDMERYTDELRALADGIYREQLRKKTGRRTEELQLLRPLVLYYAHGHLMKATALTKQGKYEEAQKFTAMYADLGWFELLDEEGLRIVEAFRSFAVGNSFTLEMQVGNFAVLPEYTAYMVKQPSEILSGLVSILEAANRFDYSVDHVLEQFSAEMAGFEQLQDRLNIERIYRLGYQLALYYSERRQYTRGVDYILQCLKAAIQLNSAKDILECVTLFEETRESAGGHQLLLYRELLKGLRKHQDLAANRERRSAMAERSF